jgi:hypothetical protein
MQRVNMVNKKQSIAEARKLLSQFAPEGESLAFINEEEARLLKAHGGSGELTEAGIPTYFFKKVVKKVSKVTKKIKERVRKIIPNEVSAVAGKIAPIVSMFNPAIGAALSAGASFDKDGSITGALKSGAKSYALGQAGRVVGGGIGNLQGNPFAPGGASFTNPFSTQGGIGSLFKPGGTGSNVLDIFKKGSDLKVPDMISGGSSGGGGIGSLFGKGFNFLKNNPRLAEGILNFGLNYFGQKEQNKENEKFQGPGYENYADVYGNRGYKDFYSQTPMQTAAYGGIIGYANGGRIGFRDGVGPNAALLRFLGSIASENDAMKARAQRYKSLRSSREVQEDSGGLEDIIKQITEEGINPEGKNDAPMYGYEKRETAAQGGPIELAYGGRSDPAMEMDYRGGGFIPVGAKERADDVPARLSKNEFVMTADAVRAAGGGSVDVGAQRMYDLMNNLEGQA